MAATTGSLFDKKSRQFEEVISRDITNILPSADPIWQDTIQSSMGVVPQQLLGRGYEIYKVFTFGYTGVFDSSYSNSDVSLYGDPNTTGMGPRLYTQAARRVWPDPEEGANSIPIVLKVGLNGMDANIALTLAELRAEATPAFLGQVITPKLRKFSEHYAHLLSLYWYVNQNTSYSLCQISSIALSTLDGAYTITFTPSNGAIDRFVVGMRVDIYSDSSGPSVRKNDSQSAIADQTNATRINVLVGAVDEVANTVTLMSASDPTGWAGAGGANPTNNDHVLLANTRAEGASPSPAFKGFEGLHSWLKFGTGSNDNKLLGANAIGTTDNGIIDVTRHPEMKSMLFNVGDYLTEHYLRKVCRSFNRARKRYGHKVDTFITEDGVLTGYEAQKIPFNWIDRTSRLSNLSNEGSSETGFMFECDGIRFKGRTSNYVPNGEAYLIRTGNSNWKRMVPPAIQGERTDPNSSSLVPFRFIAEALSGGGMSRIPVQRVSATSAGGANTRVTEMSQMPGELYMQLVPDQPTGVKLTNITSEKIYSDSSYS
jgi:hypothetical protein